MKLNNKGITLIEIIISVTLISIVLVFLFTLLIQVNNENEDNEIRSSYLVNQSTFIAQIEEDFIEYELDYGYSCADVANINDEEETTYDNLYIPRLYNYAAYTDIYDDDHNIKCIKFDYYDSNETGYNYAYLFLYKREDNKVILSYFRGDFKQSVELENFDWEENRKYDIEINNSPEYKMYSLPIVGPDYKDYSINLSYAY